MPKRLKELSGLKIGMRHKLIFSALEKYGLCTILDVVNHVATNAEIDLSKTNVLSSFRRTIENDLRSFTGVSGKLGVRYFYKDGETEVSESELSESSDGGVKNIYILKYYLIGGKNHIQGVSLLNAANAEFYPQKFGYDNWSVMELEKIKMGSRFGFIIERGREEFVSISCDKNDVPFEVVIGRSASEDINYQIIPRDKRQSLLCLNHKSVSRLSDDLNSFQCKIIVDKNCDIHLEDNGSNATYYCQAGASDIEKLYSYTAQNRTFKVTEKYPFLKNRQWEPADSKHKNTGGLFIRTGELIYYFGPH